MHEISVVAGSKTYPIYIGAGVLDQNLLLAHIATPEVMVISNPTVAQHYLGQLQTQLIGKCCESVIIPDGETYKTLESYKHIIESLLKHKFSRQCTLIALGGGVIGDLTGFVAATYQRGVNYIQVPTTLLAQVDSSVGGKTAVNHVLGKNMIGAFYQPNAVLIDVKTLASLPSSEFAAGMAEVIKYGLIYDADFFVWLENHAKAIIRKEQTILSQMISRCCEIKAEIVGQDERESGLRMILNFGHTFGHAIETSLGHGKILHGEAVAIGMILALKLSVQLAMVSSELVQRVEAWLMQMQLPVTIPKPCNIESLLEAMSRDKKKVGDTLRFIVLDELGKAVIRDDISMDQLRAVLQASY